MLVTRPRLAFAFAPVLPALYLLALPHFMDTAYSRLYVVLVLLFALPVGYLSCIFLGAPLISLLKGLRQLNTIYLSLGGALLGAIVFYVFGFGFASLLGSSKSIVPSLIELIHGAALGVLVALPFSLIAGYPFIGTAQDLD